MQYNTNEFGEIKKSLVKSPYSQDFVESRPSPPPQSYLLVADNNDFLLADSGDYLAAP